MKKSILAAGGTMLFLAATGASALEIKSGSDKVDVELSGQVNRAVMHADDGNENKFFHADNDNSSTRVGLTGKIKASETVTVGSSFEVEWQENASNVVSMDAESVAGEFEGRLMELYLSCKKTGKVSLGKGKMASEDTSETDLSGTSLAGMSDVAKVGGGFKFYDPAYVAPVPASPDEEVVDTRLSVGNVFNNMDGLAKKNRVRYDTPKFAGFSLAAAAGEKEIGDAGLFYSGEFAGTKVEGALAWADFGDDKPYSQINGSASVLFPVGLNLTFAAGTRDLDKMPAGGDDPAFMYGKIGYICDKMFSVGSTAFSVDYSVDENIKRQNKGEEGTAYGIQLVQKLSAYNTDLYAAYRSYELEDSTDADYEDISIIMAGARIKF
ncbi:MAG: porin [Candidatus Electronema sp. VV]